MLTPSPTDQSSGVQGLTIPLTRRDRDYAQRVAVESLDSAHPDVSQQIYCNQLALRAVAFYLTLMQMPTDLDASYSGFRLGRRAGDVADLYLPGRGRLECRPVECGATTVTIPPEARGDRLGYVVVQLDWVNNNAKLLGFLDADSLSSDDLSHPIPLERCTSLLHMLDVLYQARLVELRRWLIAQEQQGDWRPTPAEPANFRAALLGSSAQPIALRTPQTDSGLSRPDVQDWPERVQQLWTEAGFVGLATDLSLTEALAYLVEHTQSEEIRWQAADWLWSLEPEHPAAGQRYSKTVQLTAEPSAGLSPSGHALTLRVAILPRPEDQLAFLARLSPIDSPVPILHLPQNLEFSLQDAQGQVLFRTQTEAADPWVQIKLIAEPGDRFRLAIALDGATWLENFAV